MTDEERKQKARENSKRYYQKNKEKILARQKEYVRKRYHSDEEFRKKTLDNHKRYEQNNLERVKKIKRDAQKKYYQNHKEYYHNYSKQWSKDKFDLLNEEIERLKRNGQRVATDYAIEKAKADMYMDIINEIKEMIEQYSYNAYYYKCDSQNKFFKSEIINDLKKILDKVSDE